MKTFNNPHVAKAVDEIDASMFSGDAFSDVADRALMRAMMERWQRGLLEYDARADEDEENPMCDDCEARIGRDGCQCPVVPNPALRRRGLVNR